MADFYDLPNTIAPANVVGHLLGYEKHHVIPTDVFDDSAFLQELQRLGLWDQQLNPSPGRRAV